MKEKLVVDRLEREEEHSRQAQPQRQGRHADQEGRGRGPLQEAADRSADAGQAEHDADGQADHHRQVTRGPPLVERLVVPHKYHAFGAPLSPARAGS